MVTCARASDEGSSPLTRGKPRSERRGYRQGGLIPAHAGKTTMLAAPMYLVGAHPRSRGENVACLSVARTRVGSSPLTRGKLRNQETQRVGGGLIPAHAGKTLPAALRLQNLWAHPRSRGENVVGGVMGSPHSGSSPLTRGKLVQDNPSSADARLIPAHAGKTGACSPAPPGPRAHPRSRGENISSTLRTSPPGWLIPAHAGKTARAGDQGVRRPAHPRSRGENRNYPNYRPRSLGSSPLTRGKQDRPRDGVDSLGLIPAHAGKTLRCYYARAVP